MKTVRLAVILSDKQVAEAKRFNVLERGSWREWLEVIAQNAINDRLTSCRQAEEFRK